MFSLYNKNGEIPDELFEVLNEEQAIDAFYKIKKRLLEIQKAKLANLEKETPPLINLASHKQRKRKIPHHVGYFIKEEKDPRTGAIITTLYSRWSQGRPPKVFSGLSASEWKLYQVDKSVFLKNLLIAQSNQNFKIIHSQLGFDEQGATLEEFFKHAQNVQRPRSQ